MVTNIERIVEETFRKARQESLSQGMAQGLAQGMAQGLAQGKQESALAALQKGLDPQLVSEITGLPLDKVLELQKQILH